MGDAYSLNAYNALNSQQYTNQWTNYIYSTAASGSTITVTTPYGVAEPDDEDDRSDNEKWLDERVDEMRVSI